MKRRVSLKVGDCFVIGLPDGKRAYGQLVFVDSRMGFLVQIFDLITKEEVPVETLRTAGPLFPPVFVGLRASIRSGRWRIIGRLPIEEFVFPKFLYTHGTKPGVYDDWMVWDGGEMTFLGKLPPGLRGLEHKCIWGDELLEERIATGKNLFEALR